MKSLQTITIADQPRLSDQQREKLGVVAPPGGNEKSTSVTFADSAGATLATLLLGKEHMRQVKNSPAGGYPDGRYMSNDDGKTIYLAEESMGNLSSQPQNWIAKRLLNVNASDLARIVISAPGADPLELVHDAEGESLTLASLAENETLDSSELSTVRNALSYFDLSDIASPALNDDQLGFTHGATFLAETTGGIAHTVSIGGKAEGNNRYIKIVASKIEVPEPEDTETADDDGRVDALDEVEDLNTRLGKWTFVIPGYKAEAMLKSRDDLVEVKAEEEAETESIEIPADPAGSGAKE